MGLVNFNKIDENIEKLKLSYLKSPQPHFCLDDILIDSKERRELIDTVEDPTLIDRMKLYSFLSTRSYETLGEEDIPPQAASVISDLTSERFIKILENITGFEDIVADSSVATGGLVFIPKNSFGGLHLDDGCHPFNPNLERRLTLLLYLNEDWSDENGGHLEFWDMKNKVKTKEILPELGRLVIFDCKDLVHSVATVKGEDGKIRRAITIWYYIPKQNAPFKPSRYFSRPGSGYRNRALIFSVNCFYISYLYLKKKIGFKDDLVVNILKKLDYIFSNKVESDKSKE